MSRDEFLLNFGGSAAFALGGGCKKGEDRTGDDTAGVTRATRAFTWA